VYVRRRKRRDAGRCALPATTVYLWRCAAGGHNISGNAVARAGSLSTCQPSAPSASTRRSARARLSLASRSASSQRGASLRSCHAARHQLDYGSRRPDTRGGFGWLSRKFGFTVDNLISADVVTADGALVAGERSGEPRPFLGHPRRCGNFGVVTSSSSQLHPVGPNLASGLIVHPFARAAEILAGYREVAAAAPDELTVWVVLRKAPLCRSCRPRCTGRRSGPCRLLCRRAGECGDGAGAALSHSASRSPT